MTEQATLKEEDKEEQEGNTRTDFFDDVNTKDLENMTATQISDRACCQAKRLAMSIFNFCRKNQDYPYNDIEIISRAE